MPSPANLPQPPRPWGVTRATPIEPGPVVEYGAPVLDPETQVATYLDPTGRPIQATNAQHDSGTTRHVSRCLQTSNTDGGRPVPDDTQVTHVVPD